jgi:hypothetical protein
MDKVLTITNTRPDKAEAKDENGRTLFYVRLDQDGSTYFEFDRRVSLDLAGSNCFTVRRLV